MNLSETAHGEKIKKQSFICVFVYFLRLMQYIYFMDTDRRCPIRAPYLFFSFRACGRDLYPEMRTLIYLRPLIGNPRLAGMSNRGNARFMRRPSLYAS